MNNRFPSNVFSHDLRHRIPLSHFAVTFRRQQSSSALVSGGRLRLSGDLIQIESIFACPEVGITVPSTANRFDTVTQPQISISVPRMTLSPSMHCHLPCFPNLCRADQSCGAHATKSVCLSRDPYADPFVSALLPKSVYLGTNSGLIFLIRYLLLLS